MPYAMAPRQTRAQAISDSQRNQLILLCLLPALWVAALLSGLAGALEQFEARALRLLTSRPVGQSGSALDIAELALFAMGGAMLLAAWTPISRRAAIVAGSATGLLSVGVSVWAALAGTPLTLIVPMSWLVISMLPLLLTRPPAGLAQKRRSRIAELTEAQRLTAAFSELRATPLEPQCAADALRLAGAFAARGQHVEAARVRHFVATALTDEPHPSATELPSDSTMPNALGRYEIEGLLGKGAMGAVYLARDSRINRSVALKVVKLEREFDLSELDTAKARFFQEAESAGRLHHPNIVTIYDAGEEQGRSYIAMEHVTGVQLSSFADRQRLLPVAELIAYIACAAEALAYAHERHVIHRDIKPANLMIDRTTGQLKIMDFGVAQLNDSVRTRTGIILGTPAFMSPEQLRGEPLTGHSDLFSLGVTLYELLTGEAPFKADNVVEIARIVTAGKPIPITAIRSDLPLELERVVSKAMAKQDSERYKNGWDMASALRKIATDIESECTLKEDAN